jgi:transposase InsO family protein
VRSQPYNPQQNGKIERWWRTADERKSLDDLPRVIEGYNNGPHTSLGYVQVTETQKAHMTPNQAYCNAPTWTEEDRTWVIDGGEEIPFAADLPQ